jgi:FkbM family methyltransferase
MRSCLRWLKAWIVHWRLAGNRPSRFRRFLAAVAVLPAFLLVYLLLLVAVRLRGPILMEGTLPGGSRLNCQLPDVVQLYIFLFGVWEPDITAFVRKRLSAGDTFCDVGSHVGYYSLLASAQVGPAGRVIAIEASPSIFQQLQENLVRNSAANVRAVNVAAAAKPGSLPVHRGPAWNLGWSTTRAGHGLSPECQVPALPLDQILTNDERRSLRLIKVDVEGSERELFAGLLQLLHDAPEHAEVVLELSPRWWHEKPASIEQALQPFLDAGYHVYLVNNDYSPWRYLWPDSIQAPQRLRGPVQNNWVGQFDVVLSRADQDEL